jgi:hypothetical protein
MGFILRLVLHHAFFLGALDVLACLLRLGRLATLLRLLLTLRAVAITRFRPVGLVWALHVANSVVLSIIPASITFLLLSLDWRLALTGDVIIIAVVTPVVTRVSRRPGRRGPDVVLLLRVLDSLLFHDESPCLK